MRLKILHRTEYRYDAPVSYALQRLRLVPRSSATQMVVDWSLTANGAHDEVHFIDGFGNDTRLFSIDGAPHTILIEARGVVETTDNSGVVGKHDGPAPLWLFQGATPLCTAGKGIAALARSVKGDDAVEQLHQLMHLVRERIDYRIGTTHSETTAEEALAHGEGVCQDHAHVFLTAARLLGYPARYISGYLRMDDRDEQTASHAWAEAHVEGLGWVAFDCANGISADQRYVRVATGRDYRDAMPVMGIRLGQAQEELAVQITVEQ